jgi:uncharacterized protein (TIGR02444 family)
MSEAQRPSETTPFWRFSLHFYRQPGVSDACIALQDEYGIDVNLLLCLLWLADEGRLLSADEVRNLDEKVRGWRNCTVVPIRSIRRKLKGVRTLVEPAEQEAFRTRIKAVELEAERLQQQALYALTQFGTLGQRAEPQAAGRNNFCAYEHIMGAAFPPSTMAVLLDAFNSLEHGQRSAASGGAGQG